MSLKRIGWDFIVFSLNLCKWIQNLSCILEQRNYSTLIHRNCNTAPSVWFWSLFNYVRTKLSVYNSYETGNFWCWNRLMLFQEHVKHWLLEEIWSFIDMSVIITSRHYVMYQKTWIFKVSLFIFFLDPLNFGLTPKSLKFFPFGCGIQFTFSRPLLYLLNTSYFQMFLATEYC
jgi:hypothetical protein